MKREEALKRYYENPVICKNCGKIIEVPDGVNPSEIRRKQFCNHTCAATYNNKTRILKKNINKEGLFIKKSTCPICGNTKTYKALYCQNCSCKEKRLVPNKTLGDYISGHKYLSSKCQEIRRDAKRSLEESGREKVCAYCKNHEFDKILEIHHIKGILQFSEDTLIKEINDPTNLVYLCPNHHAMVEKGLIDLNGVLVQ